MTTSSAPLSVRLQSPQAYHFVFHNTDTFYLTPLLTLFLFVIINYPTEIFSSFCILWKEKAETELRARKMLLQDLDDQEAIFLSVSLGRPYEITDTKLPPEMAAALKSLQPACSASTAGRTSIPLHPRRAQTQHSHS
jgi:hypothetical protein